MLTPTIASNAWSKYFVKFSPDLAEPGTSEAASAPATDSAAADWMEAAADLDFSEAAASST